MQNPTGPVVNWHSELLKADQRRLGRAPRNDGVLAPLTNSSRPTRWFALQWPKPNAKGKSAFRWSAQQSSY